MASSSPKLRAIPAEAVQDMPAWFSPILDLLNSYLSDSGNAFDGLPKLELRDISYTAPSPVWTAPTFQNSWVNYGGGEQVAGYRIGSDGIVRLRALIKNGTLNTAAFTLPAGYRPSSPQAMIAHCSNGADQVGKLIIATDGSVKPVTGGNTFFSLAGVAFEAASPAALPILNSSSAVAVSYSLPDIAGVHVVSCRASSVTSATSSGAPVVDWEKSGKNSLRIKNISGLSPGVKYAIRLLLVAPT